MKELSIDRLRAAIELLEHKALAQMDGNKTTVTLYEDDVNEVLLVAGLDVLESDNRNTKDLEVIGCSKHMRN